MTAPKPPESDVERARAYLLSKCSAQEEGGHRVDVSLPYYGEEPHCDCVDTLASEFSCVRAEAFESGRRAGIEAAVKECRALAIERGFRFAAGVADRIRALSLPPPTPETKAECPHRFDCDDVCMYCGASRVSTLKPRTPSERPAR